MKSKKLYSLTILLSLFSCGSLKAHEDNRNYDEEITKQIVQTDIKEILIAERICSDGAKVTIRKNDAHGFLFRATLSNFTPNEKITMISVSQDEEIRKSFIMPLEGTIVNILNPAVKGIKQGSAKFIIKRDSETISIDYDWLDDSTDNEVQKKSDIIDLALLIEKIEFFSYQNNPNMPLEILMELNQLNKVNDFLTFISVLAKFYPNQIISWINDSKIEIKKHPEILNSLWLGGLGEEAINLAKKNGLHSKIPEIESKPPNLLEYKDNPLYINIMCGCFGLTGDVSYWKKIIDLFDNPPANLNLHLREKLFQKISHILFAMCLKHAKVYRLCIEEMNKRKSITAARLDLVIKQTCDTLEKVPFGDFNKTLSGCISILDNSFNYRAKWNAFPMQQKPIYELTSSIPINKMVKIFIIFNGQALDDNLHGKVTYDLSIYAPNGKIIKELKNLNGFDKSSPSRFFLQLADQEVDFQTTIPGKYIIEVNLKDWINNNTLNLKKEISVSHDNTNSSAIKYEKKFNIFPNENYSEAEMGIKL